MESLLEDERFRTGSARFANADAFDAIIEPWMRERTVAEIVELGQSIRAAVAPVNQLSDLLSDPHLNARKFWQQPTDSSPYYPGPPFRMSGHRWQLSKSPAISEGAGDWIRKLTDNLEVLEHAGIVRHGPHD
jgi:crotonobetainyl-CoA:carnitine CoA-transferase CaiB-like acyl-CoA transferase